MKSSVNLDSISIILVRPKFPENVGSVARAMKNMGLSRLVLVKGCSPLHMNAYKLASGAEDILERADEVLSLEEAIAPMACVVGATSRQGRARSPLLTPGELIEKIIPVSQNNPVALVFGSEKEGLTGEELSLCHLYLRIPASDDFPSLNLAQAVMVMGYELFKASGKIPKRPPRVAQVEQLEKMIEHMEKTLSEIGFLDPSRSKPILKALRSLFGRTRMDEREVRILQGIWSQIDWYIRRREEKEVPKVTEVPRVKERRVPKVPKVN